MLGRGVGREVSASPRGPARAPCSSQARRPGLAPCLWPLAGAWRTAIFCSMARLTSLPSVSTWSSQPAGWCITISTCWACRWPRTSQGGGANFQRREVHSPIGVHYLERDAVFLIGGTSLLACFRFCWCADYARYRSLLPGLADGAQAVERAECGRALQVVEAAGHDGSPAVLLEQGP